ncbi:MAG: DUF3887 domain-containing protein, partial [Chloroflexi bacterium]|nr:DUF3887 domain-containing protein [Chloroflexota bacterium]
MNVIGRALVVALVTLGLAACASGDPGPSATTASGDASAAPATPSGGTTDPAAIGRAFIEALAAGDMTAAEAMEDATMRKAAPAAALGQLWGQILGQFGAYGGLGGVTLEEKPPYVTATVETHFLNAAVPLLVTVSGDGLVAGLHLGQPGPATSGSPSSASPEPSEGTSPAAYVDPEAFTETEVTVGAAPWALPGTLSMPRGDGPFPALVLVAGSGPQDRDETIGPNKPLRDVAWGLASSGIAVLRYEKRTKAHGAEMAVLAARLTVREETTDDAIAAVDLLRGTKGIDPERVFLAGHSLGGYLAPRIAAAAPGRLAGIALLEANASPLQRLIADQLAYLASDEGGADPQAGAMLEALPGTLSMPRGDGPFPALVLVAGSGP